MKIEQIKMPFWNMVGFIIKWFFASIVAVLIICIAFAAIGALISYFSGAELNMQLFTNEMRHYSSTLTKE